MCCWWFLCLDNKWRLKNKIMSDSQMLVFPNVRFPLSIFSVLCSAHSHPADLKQCFYQIPLLLRCIEQFPILILDMSDFLCWLSRASITWLHSFYPTVFFFPSSFDKLALYQLSCHITFLLHSLLITLTVFMFFADAGNLYSRSRNQWTFFNVQQEFH